MVLFNRRNNQIQLGTNAYPTETLERRNSASSVCPTCHRPLGEGETSHSPPFMDSEYFQLLSAHTQEFPTDDELPAEDDELPSASRQDERSNSLPNSTFNQGYFERYFTSKPILI